MDPFYLFSKQIVRLRPAPGKFRLRLSLVAVLLGPTLLAQPVLVKDINRTSPPGVGARELINVNGQVFFMANDGLTGFELWKSDGTAGGTQLVKDISPVDSYPGGFTNVN